MANADGDDCRLKEIDVVCMKSLCKRGNVVPVVAKSDSLSKAELAAFKKRVMEDIAHHKIEIYDFPSMDDDDDEIVEENALLKSLLPFAVVGSDNTYDGADGRKFHGRRYLWGTVNVEDPSHSDFLKLSEMLFLSHLHILKEITNDYHYENYRVESLQRVGVVDHLKIEQELQERERASLERKEREREESERRREDNSQHERRESELRVEAARAAQEAMKRQPSLPTPINPNPPAIGSVAGSATSFSAAATAAVPAPIAVSQAAAAAVSPSEGTPREEDGEDEQHADGEAGEKKKKKKEKKLNPDGTEREKKKKRDKTAVETPTSANE